MAVQQLFRGKLTGSFKPTKPFLIPANRITLYFDLVTSAGPTTVQWYLEFTDDPTGAAPIYRREIAEEDAGGGLVLMPEVVRTFANNGGTALSDGTYNLDAEFKRENAFCRVQMRVAGGAAQVTVSTPFVGATPLV